MARRVQLPESRLRKKKRTRRVRLAAALSVAGILLVGGLAGLSWLPQVRIHTIAVSGAQTLATSSIEAVATKLLGGRLFVVLPRDNIFWYPKKEISQDLLSQYPALKEAQVYAKDLQSVEIDVAERAPVALWCDDAGSCSLMDASGFVYSPDLSLDTPLFVRYSGAATTSKGYAADPAPLQYLTPADFSSLAHLVELLDGSQQDAAVDTVGVDQNGDVQAHFADGFTLIFALKDAGADVFSRFTLALAAKPFLNKTIADFQYLDLRFGDKLYYKEH